MEDSGKNDGLLRRKRLRELLFQNCQSAADNNCVEDVRLVPFLLPEFKDERGREST